MNTRNYITLIFILILMLLRCVPLTAQNVTNVTAEQVDKTIHVSYDLDKTAHITLHLSTDGGKTYTELQKVSGAVGKNVPPGHLTIVWNVLDEMENLQGNNIVFKVKAESSVSIPTVTTDDNIFDITSTSAVIGGFVSSDGGASVIARGFCWSTSRNPSLSADHSTNGREIGYFSTAIYGLKPNTTYYVRSYATNSKGTGYGKVISFTTKKEEQEKKMKEGMTAKEEKVKKVTSSIPYSTFFTLNVAYSSLPQLSYGFKVGGVKRVGWFASVMTNFNFAGWGNPFNYGCEYYLTGDSKTIRFSAQAGFVYQPVKPLSLLLGVGYGYRTLTYKTNFYQGEDFLYSEWRSYLKRTCQGVDVSLGLLFDIKGFALSAEAVTTNFQTIEAKIGVGLCLPHKKSKNKTKKC